MAVFNSPNTTDAFSRYFIEMFNDRDMISVAKGFQAFFGNPANGGRTIINPDSKVVDIDIMRGNKKIAALIPRGGVSRSLGGRRQTATGEDYSTFSRVYPLAEEIYPISGDKILKSSSRREPRAEDDQTGSHAFGLPWKVTLRICAVMAICLRFWPPSPFWTVSRIVLLVLLTPISVTTSIVRLLTPSPYPMHGTPTMPTSSAISMPHVI